VTISSWLNFGRPAPPGHVCGGAKIFGSALLLPACSICVSSERFFHFLCVRCVVGFRLERLVWGRLYVSRRVSPQNHVEERLSFRFSLLFYCVIVPGPTHISYAHGMHDSLLVPLNTKEPTNFIQTRPNRLHVYIYVCLQ